VTERLLGIPVWVAVAGLLGLGAAIALYERGLGVTMPEYALSESAIATRAREFAAANGRGAETIVTITETTSLDDDDFDRMVERFGLAGVRDGRRDGTLPLPAWTVRLRRDVIWNDFDDDPDAVRVWLDERGRVLGATFSGARSKDPAPPRDEAQRLAAERLTALGVDMTGFAERSKSDDDGVDVRVGSEGARVDPPKPGPDAETEKAPTKHSFVWQRKDPRWPDVVVTLNASVTAAGLSSFNHNVDIENAPLPPGLVGLIVQGTAFGIATTLLVLVLLGVFLSRLTMQDYVSFDRAAIVTGLFSLAVIAATVVSTPLGNSALEVSAGVLAIAIFVGILIWPAFLAGEADSYFSWGPQNAQATVALLTGRVRARQVARSAVEGFLWGWALLGALAIAAAAIAAFNPALIHRRPDMYAVDTHPTALFWLGCAPFAMVVAVIGLLFAPAWVHRVTRRGWIGILVGGAVAGMLATMVGLANVRFGVLPAILSWGLPFGIACAAVAARRGWLTAAIATYAFTVWYTGLAPVAVGATGDAVMSGIGLLLATAPAAAAFAFGPRLADVTVTDAPPPRVSRIMEQARREEELNIARRVQSALLPSEDPEVEGLDVAGTCTPANEVGGDYFDYFQFPDGRFGVAVGDVSGKGVPAAFCMTLTKGFMEVAASEAREPATVLGLANGHLRENLTRGTFVTMAYAVVDPESRVVTCARAGHNPPAILRDGEPPEFLSPPGTALGAAPEEQFNELIESVRVELRRGDTLVFYTDGVTEAMNGAREQFGEERLLETLERLRDGRTARGLVDGLLGELESYASDADQHDDITVVVIRAE
jgi:hypothetical protein